MADQETLSLKVLVEKKKNRVVLAEADNDFIDMLFSFLTLPMGTIVRLVRKQSPMEEIGCMTKIYESVENCEVRALRTEACKTMLLWPKNVAEAQCGTLKFKMDDREPDKFYLCTENHTESRFTSHYKNVLCKCGRVMDKEISGSVGVKDEDGRVFAKETARFMLSDDLHVMPVSISTSFSLLQKLGIDDQSTLEKRTLNLGVDEVLHLLKCSLLSKTPLSDLVFRDGPLHGFCNVKLEPRTTIHSSNQSETATEREKIAVKLMISTSKQMALFAEVGEDFVDLLFSFLTFPLGSVVELLGGSCSMGCIDSLYQSVKDLDVDRYIKSEERKGMLVSPKLAPDFGYDNQPLHLQQAKHPSYESGGIEVTVVDPKSNSRETTSGSGFVKRSTMFMVTDDLVVTPVSPISSLFLLNRMEVLLCDVEERLLKLGEGEVLTLLKASLISKTVLTDLFTSMKPKEEEYDSDPAHVSYQTKPKQEPLFY